MTSLQHEAEWERIHADLEEAGLGVNAQEKFLAYIVKVGPPLSETIWMDRRPRPDKSGGTTTRLPDTWEECHEVLCEIEGVKAGSKAFANSRAACQVPRIDRNANKFGGQQNQGFQDGGFKGRWKSKGKEKGKQKGKGDGERRKAP